MSDGGAGPRSDRRRSNRLAGEISPYLRLHQHNPVDWYPWGDEALSRAKDEDKPIFLSVGYATCYWCHVMERESFSDAGTAALMNRHFVNVKVDREERPDLDEIYMAATQIFTQQGGWPNSVFLTPDLEPFFAGTYFPPSDGRGRPSFKTVLLSMQNAWETRRGEVEEQGREMASAMRRMLEERGKPLDHVAPADITKASVRSLVDRYDASHGGFGAAPKFPSPANLFLLLELAGDDSKSAEMLDRTLDGMARGGLNDQLAGGFHRYSTDAAWKVPHFEKMLYDNGLLMDVYARRYGQTGDAEHARVLIETARFLSREMTGPDGELWSAIDAEVAGREGAYHVWTQVALADALGPEDAGFLAPLYGYDGPPVFDREYYVLHRPLSWGEQAERRRMPVSALLDQVEPLKARLLEVREQRPRPLVDDKVLTDWNGMAIAGLATAGAMLERPGMVDQARRAAEFVISSLRSADGTLLHSWCAGEARFEAFLPDYVFLVRGLLALHDATEEDRWLEEAADLTEQQVARLGDAADGGFFIAAESEDLLFRSKEIFDGALPATNAVAALNLLELARRGDRDRWLPEVEKTLKAFTLFTEKQPEGARMMATAVAEYHRLVAAPSDEEATRATVVNLVEQAARRLAKPVLEVGDEGADGFRPFRLEVTLKKRWHVYAHEPGLEGLTPTSVSAPGAELRDVTYPAGEDYPPKSRGADGLSARVYRDVFEIRGALKGSAELNLRYQPCDDARCLPATSVAVTTD
ncbi:MAG: thioredoxin domain-containing protein [Acidobacteriota bacterium]